MKLPIFFFLISMVLITTLTDASICSDKLGYCNPDIPFLNPTDINTVSQSITTGNTTNFTNYWTTATSQSGLTGVKTGSYDINTTGNGTFKYVEIPRHYTAGSAFKINDNGHILSGQMTDVGYGGIGFDNYWTGSQWKATDTSAVLFYKTPTGFNIYVDEGLTAGNTYSPNIRFSIDGDGLTTINGRTLVNNPTDDTYTTLQVAGNEQSVNDITDGISYATTGSSFTYGYYTFDFLIYAYKTVGATTIYSPNYFETGFTDNNGQILTINSIPDTAGSGYTDGDYCTVQNGNYDSVIQISVGGSGEVIGVTLIYGGSGYSTGGFNVISSCDSGDNGDATIEITDVVSGTYDVQIDWDAVAGADGYKLIIFDTFSGYAYDYSITTATNSLTYDGTGVTTDVTITPTSMNRAGRFESDVSIEGYLNMNNKNINNGVNVVDSNFIGNQAGGVSAGTTSATDSNFLGNSAGYDATNAPQSNFIGKSAGSGATSASNSNFFGYNTGEGATGASNSNFLGPSAGYFATGASNSNFLGTSAGEGATGASESNFIGSNAGSGATDAPSSNFMGNNAGVSATNAYNSNFIGNQAGNGATGSYNSNFIGQQAGYETTSAFHSNFFGRYTGFQASGASSSNFIGYQAGYQANKASTSNFFGFNAGYQAQNASSSNFIGEQAGYASRNATKSNFIGTTAGFQATNANASTFIGMQAGYNAVNSRESIFIGTNAGYTASNASMMIMIGSASGYQAIRPFNSIFIGKDSGYRSNATRSIFIGERAGLNSRSITDGVFLGYSAGEGAYNANLSVAIANGAGYGANNAYRGIFIGTSAGYLAINASSSIFLGRASGDTARNAMDSIFIGSFAGYNDKVNNTLNNGTSIAIGRYSGTCGFSDSIAIGRGVCNSKANQINIGNVIVIDGINNSDVTTNKTLVNATITLNGNVNTTQNLIIYGNLSVKRPYYTGYDNSTQSFINTANTQVINISNNQDYDSWLIHVVGKQNLTFDQTGDYQCTLSPEFFQNGGGSLVTFWVQKNGVDVPWSNSRYSMSNNEYHAPSIIYQFDIHNPATDNIRFMWWSDSTSTQIYSSGALTLPTRPSIPGVLITCLKVSEVT